MAADPDTRRLRDEIEALRKGLSKVIEANRGALTSEEVLAFSKRLDEAIVLFQLSLPEIQQARQACGAFSGHAVRIAEG